MRKPTLGIYGPAGCDRSGVTDYLDLLERQLSEYFDCVRVSNSNYRSPSCFDRRLYNVGNNLLHRCAFRAMRELRGTVLIHEFICLDYYLSDWDFLPEQEQSFLLHGYSNLLNENFSSASELNSYFEKHRCFDRYCADIRSESLFVNQAGTMLLHSKAVTDFLQGRYPHRSFLTIPFPVAEIDAPVRSQTRKRMKVPDAFIFGTFGFIGEYKRLEKVFAAWHLFEDAFPNAYLVVVGEQQYDIAIPHNQRIVYHPYLEDCQEFDEWLLSIDCGIQLRSPSLGETSATISKLVANNIPVIVSRIPFMSEIENYACVYPILPDAFEIESLCDHMKQIAALRPSSPRYNVEHSPLRVAAELFDIITSEES